MITLLRFYFVVPESEYFPFIMWLTSSRPFLNFRMSASPHTRLRDRMAEWETTLERWDAEGVCGDIEVVADGVEPGEVLVVPGSEMAAGGPNLTEFAATAFALGVDVGLSPEAAAGFYIDDDMEGFYEGDEQQLQWLSSWEDSTIEGDECDHFDNDGASSGVSDMPSSDGTERPSAGGTGAVDDSSDINSCGEDAT